MPTKITMSPAGVLQVPEDPIIPFIEGDGTGVDIWPAAKLVLDAAAAKHGRSVAWKEVLAGEKAFDETGELAARRDGRGVPRAPDRDQGAAHHPDRRRHPLAQRGASPAARPVRLPAARCAGSPACRPRCATRRRSTWSSSARTPRTSMPASSCKRARPRRRRLIAYLTEQFGWTIRPDSGIGIKPDLGDRLQAPRAGGHRVRRAPRAQERHPGAQGQHPEVHRGRVPQLGLRARARRVLRRRRRLGRLRRRPGGQDPREGRRSPTSRSSRCSPGRTSSTSSPRRT